MLNKLRKPYSALYVVIFLITVATRLSAAPHNGDRYEFTQPDGVKVPVLIWGDEFFQHVESPEGYTLMRNKETGWICYATLSEDSSELIPTNYKYRTNTGLSKTLVSSSAPEHSLPAHIRLPAKYRLLQHRKMQQQVAGGAPRDLPAGMLAKRASSVATRPEWVKRSTGRYTGLTILIDFSDEEATMSVDTVRDFVNKQQYTGFGNNGSVRDFYYDVSGGKVIYENIVVGYYRAKEKKSYYDTDRVPFGERAQELILEALEWLEDDGFDFSQLTLYHSSMDSTHIKIQALNILYAGDPEANWGEGLWPHQSRLNSVKIGDIYADIYQMSAIRNDLSIGTFCHENGHMLFFWPDLYDYGYESAGVGVFCLMSSTGTKNPIPPCAWLRDFSRWDAVTDITGIPEGTVLTQLPDNINTTFAYRNSDNPDEMFYIEARRPEGRYENLPGGGFLIWHVDQNGSNDYEEGSPSYHYQVSLEQADGEYDFELGTNSTQGEAKDLFKADYNDRFDDTTEPDARWWDGSTSGMKVYNMSEVSDTMSFSIGELKDSYHTIIASAGVHGSITPHGSISAVSGSSLPFIMTADSGYILDALSVDGSNVGVKDTFLLEDITGAHTIEAVFGLNAALGVLYPQDNALLYAGDSVTIQWKTRGITLAGVDIAFSSDGGVSFTPVASGIAATDTTFIWKLPVVESEECLIRVVDTDADPEAFSGIFSVRKKPSVVVPSDVAPFIVGQERSGKAEMAIGNAGTGEMHVTVATARQVRGVMINELFVGSDNEDANDGIEIWNSGPDIDMSGWKLHWAYMEQVSGFYTFPDGFILERGEAFFLHDKEHEATDSTAYLGVELMWNLAQELALAVTLYDGANRAVDFVKTEGSADRPPEGTSWKGSGVKVTDEYVYRIHTEDSDSAADWQCGSSGSLRTINEGQRVSDTPLVTLSVPGGTAKGGGSVVLTVTYSAGDRALGDYRDTLVVYHNDPVKENPLFVPLVISVVDPMNVKAEPVFTTATPAVHSPFSLAPNPVRSGDNVHFYYRLTGDETVGRLFIFNSVGNCMHAKEINFTRRSARGTSFSFTHTLDGYHRGSYVARLIVKRKTGRRDVYTAMIGVR